MKIGDKVSIKTALINKYLKVVPWDYEGTLDKTLEFEIVGKFDFYQSFLIIVPDNITGWLLNNFHVEFCDVDKAHLGKKFNEINSLFIEAT
jgi:hypothetical protein